MFGLVQTMVQSDSLIHAIDARIWYDMRYVAGENTASINLIPDRSGRAVDIGQAIAGRQPTIRHNVAGVSVARFALTHWLTSSLSASLDDTAAHTTFIVGNTEYNQTYQQAIINITDSTAVQQGAILLARSVTANYNMWNAYQGVITGGVNDGLLKNNAASSGDTGFTTSSYVGVYRADYTKQADSFAQVSIYRNAVASAYGFYFNNGVMKNLNFVNRKVTVGAQYDGAASPLGGDISHIVVIPKSLTQAEVTAVTNALRQISGV